MTKIFHKQLLSFDGSREHRDAITELIMDFPSLRANDYHLCFCLDESGSMRNDWGALISAVEAFLQKRIELCTANGVVAVDRVSCVNYGSKGRVVFANQDISTNLVKRIQFESGGTNFAAGLQTTLKCMESAQVPSSLIPCLIFMSDGCCKNGDKEMEEIRKVFPNAIVFVIGFTSMCDRERLEQLAKLGMGQFFFGVDEAELKTQFETVSVTISGGVVHL